MNNAIEQLLSDIKKMQECGCGVTTGSFAPAVTNTIYPKPNKKEKSFREKVNNVFDELTQQELDDLYSKDDEDSSEKTWTNNSDWKNANWNEYNKNQIEIQKQKETPKTDFVNKYKERNKKIAKELDDLYYNFYKDPNINIVALDFYFNQSKKQLIRAIVDCKNYENMSIDEFNKIEKPKMKPINTKFEYWKMKKINPEEYNN